MRTTTKNKVTKVNTLVSQGDSVFGACKKIGLSYTTYLKYKNATPTETTTTTKTYPTTASFPMMVVFGTPEQVANVVRTYNQV